MDIQWPWGRESQCSLTVCFLVGQPNGTLDVPTTKSIGATQIGVNKLFKKK